MFVVPCLTLALNRDFRNECIKLAIMVTDNVAGECQNPSRADSFISVEDAANNAKAAGVVVSALQSGSLSSAREELETYTSTTGGLYNSITSSDAAEVLTEVLEDCGGATFSPTSVPAPMPTRSMGVRGDPHVTKSDGHRVDIYLQPGVWTYLLQGEEFALSGRVFSRNVSKSTQWFDGFRVELAATRDVVVEIALPHDVELGKVGKDQTEIQYLAVTLDGRKLDKTDATYSARDVEVTASKLDSHVRGGRNPIYNDRIQVATHDFDISVIVSRETNRDLFDTPDEGFKETHCDLKFTKVPNARNLVGPLAEILFPDLHDTLSPEATAMVQAENAEVPIFAQASDT